MRDYTSDNPVFHKKISIVEEDDLVSADNDTAAAKQLIENDLVLNDRMEECLGKDPDYGDSQNLIVTFESGDSESADAWTDVEAMQSKEEHRSLFRKLSIMVKNVRYLYKLLGTTDISKFGGGTVTGAIKDLEDSKPGEVTQSTHGLMTAADKKKLDEIAEKANNYTHPSSHAASMITQDATHRFVSDTNKNAWNNKLNQSDVTQSAAVTVAGQKALDAVEKNASIEGTLANELSKVNSNLNIKIRSVPNADGQIYQIYYDPSYGLVFNLMDGNRIILGAVASK